ncbi:MAG: oligosaccharide flippase family protein [Chloroflexota bacterium]|nr:oligosaccharide flippase family protein [Chloroflexota bacterium]
MTEAPGADELAAEALACAGLGRRVVANTFAQLVAPVLRAVVGVGLFAILGRYLGVAGFGEYGLVIAYVLLFTNALGDWGLATILVREISRRPAERPVLIASATALQLALAVLSYLVVLAIALFSSYPADVRSSLALFGLTLLLAPVQMLSAHFATDLRLTRLVPPAVAGTLTQLVLTVVAVALHGPLLAVIAANTASVVVEMGWTALIALRELRFGRPTLAPWRLFLGESWPLAIGTLLATAAKQAPLLLLSSVGLNAVGVYAAATKIPDYLSRIPYAFRTTMFPLLSRRWHEGSGFTPLVARTVAGTLGLTAPVAILGVAAAPLVVGLVFGRAFVAAAVPFAVLLVAFVLSSLAVLLEAALVSAGAQRIDLVIRAVASALLLALLVVLARDLGPTGSALAVATAAAVTVVLMIVVLRQRARSLA